MAFKGFSKLRSTLGKPAEPPFEKAGKKLSGAKKMLMALQKKG